jgi:hypothetical protein
VDKPHAAGKRVPGKVQLRVFTVANVDFQVVAQQGEQDGVTDRQEGQPAVARLRRAPENARGYLVKDGRADGKKGERKKWKGGRKKKKRHGKGGRAEGKKEEMDESRDRRKKRKKGRKQGQAEES